MVLIAAAMAGVAVSFASPWVAGLAAGALIWSLLLVRHWSLAVPVILAASVAMPRYVYVLDGVSVNIERLLIPVLFALFILRSFGNSLVLDRVHLLLILSISVNVLSSALNAPDTNESLRLTLLITIATLPFWLLPNIARDGESIRTATFIFILIGVLEAAFGLIAAVTYTVLGVNIGVQLDPLTGAAAAYGSQWEGNTFGSFVAAAAAMTLGWLAFGHQTRPTRFLGWLALAVLTGGLIASLSRGAWLGAAAGAAIVVLYTRQRWKIAGLAAAVVTLAVGLTLSEVWQPSSPGLEQAAALTRLSFMGDLLQGNVDGIVFERLYTYDLAFRGWLEQPVIGWGAGALGQRFSYLSVELPAWVGNLELHALHDGGLLGALGLLGAMGGTTIGLVRAVRRQPAEDRQPRGVLVGLLAGCVALLVAYQATEATWLGYTWYVFGLAWAGARVLGREAQHADQAHPAVTVAGGDPIPALRSNAAYRISWTRRFGTAAPRGRPHHTREQLT